MNGRTSPARPTARRAPAARRRSVVAALAGLALAAGCRAPQSQATRPQPYLGPTESIDAVVAKINANNAKLSTLWARQDVEADVVDDQGKTHFVNGYGNLLYRAPREMRLTAKKEVTDLFEVGSTDEQFWLRVVPEADTLWYGSYRNVGKPCCKPMPIRPDLILQVLGVGIVDSDFLREPAPTMRFNNDADAYMFVWSARRADRWVAEKEVWYDRATLRPQRILLFDDAGRVVLRAYLRDFAPVDAAPLPKEQWPAAATRYDLFFPGNGTKMSFTLHDVAVSHNGYPKPGGIRLPSVDPSDYKQVICVDGDCADGASGLSSAR